MSKQSRTIFITVVATLLAVLILQNLRSVDLRFIVWDFSAPLVLVLLLVFGGGLATGYFWRRG